ncbi:nitrite/sulfite reductase [Clostridium chrysemydis]|uniref:nitrite/sulfite reductase n=1 Tax=Clostridium chrysemydis TaxID=2665504 RepID=UPI0018847DB1
MSELKEILRKEIREFREQGHKFVNKELNVAQFKAISGGMGAYAHRGGETFMIRIKTPSGMASKEDLNKIYEWATRYKLESVHPTTREAVQLHGLTIDEVCDVMEEALDYGIITRGGGGNFPRNVAMSPLAGVLKDEPFDVTPYAKAINDHIASKVYTYKLPRKLKIAMSSNENDEAHCTAVDMGFVAIKNNGENAFSLYIGGGLGRNPRTAVKFDEIVKPEEIIYHVEAMTNLFMAEGDYKNKGKARIRYIADRMGDEAFKECYKKHLEEVLKGKDLTISVKPVTISKKGIKTDIKHKRLVEQKTEGLYSVYFHPIGGILKTEDLKMIIDLTKDMEDVDYRFAMTEGMYIRNLNGEEALKVLELTNNKGGEIDVMQSISCIGVPVCQMGLCNSQGLLNNIVNLLKEKDVTKDLLPKVHISGCANSCGVHEIGEIGFTGKSKRVNDEVKKCFELHVGGSFKVGETKLAKVYGDIVEDEIPNYIYDLYKTLEEKNVRFETWYKDNESEFLKITKKYLV